MSDTDRAAVGHLEDGTAYYAPFGEMAYDADEASNAISAESGFARSAACIFSVLTAGRPRNIEITSG